MYSKQMLLYHNARDFARVGSAENGDFFLCKTYRKKQKAKKD
jgi:hypothetical protein